MSIWKFREVFRSKTLNAAATYLGQALASAHAISDQDYNSAIVQYSIDKQVSNAVTSTSGLAIRKVAGLNNNATRLSATACSRSHSW